MTPEQQRIAIAEFRGWTEISPRMMWGLPPNIFDEGTEHCLRHLPNYINDLNAIHDAWLTLSTSEKEQFESELYLIVIGGAEYNRNDDAGWITNATAAQRAEAFLKTLNIWTP